MGTRGQQGGIGAQPRTLLLAMGDVAIKEAGADLHRYRALVMNRDAAPECILLTGDGNVRARRRGLHGIADQI